MLDVVFEDCWINFDCGLEGFCVFGECVVMDSFDCICDFDCVSLECCDMEGGCCVEVLVSVCVDDSDCFDE